MMVFEQINVRSYIKTHNKIFIETLLNVKCGKRCKQILKKFSVLGQRVYTYVI